MKLFLKELKLFALIAAIAAVIWLAVSLGNGWRPAIELTIDTDRISYANCAIGGQRSRLDYAENVEVFNELCEALSGSCRYVGTWNHRGIDGGGPEAIAFYDTDRNLVASFRYRRGCICVSSERKGMYYLYLPKNREISFSAFEEAVEKNGYTPRYW